MPKKSDSTQVAIDAKTEAHPEIYKDKLEDQPGLEFLVRMADDFSQDPDRRVIIPRQYYYKKGSKESAPTEQPPPAKVRRSPSQASPPKIVMGEPETPSEEVQSNLTAVMIHQHSHAAVTRENADLSPSRLRVQYVLDNNL